jgi:type IV pilus assembly protein PilW
MNHIELKQFHAAPSRQGGFTLIEMMVAMTIGLIILAALGQLFVSSRSTYNMGEGVARTQEAGRFAMEFLTLDIRQAGYAGCHNPSDGAGTVTGNGAGTGCTTSFCNLADPADESTRFAAEGVRGYVYTGGGTNNLADWEPDLPAVFFADGEVKARTDVIVIQYASSMGVTLTGNLSPSNANVKIDDLSPWVDGDPDNGEIVDDDILIVSDCKNTDIFRATTVGGSGTIPHSSVANESSHLTHSYGADAELLRLETRAYFVADNATSGEPALMRKSLGSGGAMGAAQELVQGIEDMRIRYGVDTDLPAQDGIANRYVLADDVVDLTGPGTTNWDNVVSVRLGLLIRTPVSVDPILDTSTYELVDGVVVDPVDDNRRRQMYRTTIKLRNNCKNGVACY